jgi:hypothetical protein
MASGVTQLDVAYRPQPLLLSLSLCVCVCSTLLPRCLCRESGLFCKAFPPRSEHYSYRYIFFFFFFSFSSHQGRHTRKKMNEVAGLLI